MNLLAIILLIAIILVLAFFLSRLLRESKDLRTRYAGIADIDAEIKAAKIKLDDLDDSSRRLLPKTINNARN